VVAASLILLGASRFYAALVSLPSGPILKQIQEGKAVDGEDLENLIDSQKRAIQWNESARRWTDLGLAQLLAADGTVNEKDRKQALGAAEKSLIRGLSMSPASAFAWTRLAYVDLAMNGPSRSVAKKLNFAVTRAPYDRRILFSRLRLGLLVWAQFDGPEQSVQLEQIKFAWRVNPARLVSLVANMQRTNVVRAALFTNPDSIAKFEQLLKKHVDQKL